MFGTVVFDAMEGNGDGFFLRKQTRRRPILPGLPRRTRPACGVSGFWIRQVETKKYVINFLCFSVAGNENYFSFLWEAAQDTQETCPSCFWGQDENLYIRIAWKSFQGKNGHPGSGEHQQMEKWFLWIYLFCWKTSYWSNNSSFGLCSDREVHNIELSKPVRNSALRTDPSASCSSQPRRALPHRKGFIFDKCIVFSVFLLTKKSLKKNRRSRSGRRQRKESSSTLIRLCSCCQDWQSCAKFLACDTSWFFRRCLE